MALVVGLAGAEDSSSTNLSVYLILDINNTLYRKHFREVSSWLFIPFLTLVLELLILLFDIAHILIDLVNITIELLDCLALHCFVEHQHKFVIFQRILPELVLFIGRPIVGRREHWVKTDLQRVLDHCRDDL